MDLCITHPTFHPTTGAVESQLLHLCRGLLCEGHSVHALVGTLGGRPEREEIEGIPVARDVRLNPGWLRARKADLGVPPQQEAPDLRRDLREMYQRFLEEQRIELVHGHNLHVSSPEAALALTELWAQGMPSLLTVHEIGTEASGMELLQQTQWDTTITTSEYLTRELRACAPHLQNVQKVYPGIDVERFSPENTNPKWVEPLGLQDRPVILHPARMLAWKGIAYSVRAMDRIRREFPNALLIITEPEENGARGDDRRNDRDELFRTIESLDLQRHVLTQPFPYVDMPWVYNECDVVIYPTIGEEPFGLVPVEAMACERPVVVSRSGGLVETVVDGETGFIVEKEDADALAERVLTLLRDRELAAGMGRAGRERAVQLFSRDRMVRETIDLYQDARRRHGSSPAMEYALA